MARRRQEGNLFFRLDVDFFSDRKVKILKARYGADGITLYLYLLCEIYKTGYYLKIDRDFEYIVSDDLNMESNKVKQVLNFLLERSLFDNTLFQSDKVLTSAGIQRRYQASIDGKIRDEQVTERRSLRDRHFLSENKKSSDYSESSLYNTIEAKGIKVGGFRSLHLYDRSQEGIWRHQPGAFYI